MKKLIGATKVIVVRVYVLQKAKYIRELIDHLEKKIQIHGLSIFNVVKGYGETGEHYLSALDGIWDNPVVIEFFDKEEKIQQALDYLNEIIKPEHIIFWEAYANLESKSKAEPLLETI
jgi:PII-like signaling protein